MAEWVRSSHSDSPPTRSNCSRPIHRYPHRQRSPIFATCQHALAGRSQRTGRRSLGLSRAELKKAPLGSKDRNTAVLVKPPGLTAPSLPRKSRLATNRRTGAQQLFFISSARHSVPIHCTSPQRCGTTAVAPLIDNEFRPPRARSGLWRRLAAGCYSGRGGFRAEG